MSEPLVTAIIPTYNYARYMDDCVGSVLGQSYPNVELIVIDDGGTDNTRKRLEPYMDRIRYVYQENQGVGGRATRASNWRAANTSRFWMPMICGIRARSRCR